MATTLPEGYTIEYSLHLGITASISYAAGSAVTFVASVAEKNAEEPPLPTKAPISDVIYKKMPIVADQ